MSYRELTQRARRIARGLLALGIEPQDRISILSETRPKWTLVDFGAFCAGATVAPIYHTNSPQECAYVLADAASRLVFCENAAQAKKVADVRDACPSLEHIVLLEGEAPGAMSLDELSALGDAIADEAVDERVRTTGARAPARSRRPAARGSGSGMSPASTKKPTVASPSCRNMLSIARARPQTRTSASRVPPKTTG